MWLVTYLSKCARLFNFVMFTVLAIVTLNLRTLLWRVSKIKMALSLLSSSQILVLQRIVLSATILIAELSHTWRLNAAIT